ncbi:MAG: hypothetical protein NC910_01635 [Candidatus Omnitrophica bacterium]|nr:hypothetical protein [Candidatus Omnitrophota bacterium]
MKSKWKWIISIAVLAGWWFAPTSIPLLAGTFLFLGLAWWGFLIAGSMKPDRTLWRLILTAAGLRLAAAFGLYFCSFFRWPLFIFQQHEVPGYWWFAMDSLAAHLYGEGTWFSWMTGAPYPVYTHGAIEYYLFLAVIYWLFGVHPLFGILANVWFSILQVLLAYKIVERLFNKRSALLAAWLVALWPSGILWATQLLKDTLCGFFVLSILLASIALWQSASIRQEQPWLRRVGWFLLLAFSMAATTKFRSYLGIALALSVAMAFGAGLLWSLIRRRAGPATMAVLISCVSVGSMVFAYQTPYPQRWFTIDYAIDRTGRLKALFDQQAASESWILYEGASWDAIIYEGASWDAIIGEAMKKRALTVHQIVEFYKPAGVLIDMKEGEKPTPSMRPVGPRLFDIPDPRLVRVWAINPRRIEIHRPWQEASFRIEGKKYTNLWQEERISLRSFWSSLWPAGQFKAIAQRWKAPKIRTHYRKADSAMLESADLLIWEISATMGDDGDITYFSLYDPVRVRFLNPREVITEQNGRAANARVAYRSLYDLMTWGWGIRPRQIFPITICRPAITLVEMNMQAVVSSFAAQASLRSFMSVRLGILNEGGRSTIYPESTFRTSDDLIRFIPKALAVSWLSPFPHQWFDPYPTTGAFMLFGSVETFVFYLLLPWILLGGWRLIRHGQAASWAVVGFILFSSLILGLVIPNVGTLFRLRLPMILACLLLFPMGALKNGEDAKA